MLFFKDQRITDGSLQRDQFKVTKDTFIDKLIENLNLRFPDNNSLSSFAIFDPQRLPSEANLATYIRCTVSSLWDCQGIRGWCRDTYHQ